MRVDPLGDARLVSATLHYRLHHASRISGVPIGLKKESELSPLQVGAQFVRQCREDRHVTIRLAFGMRDVDLWWIAVEEQVFYADVDELVDSGSGLEQRL